MFYIDLKQVCNISYLLLYGYKFVTEATPRLSRDIGGHSFKEKPLHILKPPDGVDGLFQGR